MKREEIIPELEEFLDFLLKEGYCDTDVYAEPPSALDRYVAKHLPLNTLTEQPKGESTKLTLNKIEETVKYYMGDTVEAIQISSAIYLLQSHPTPEISEEEIKEMAKLYIEENCKGRPYEEIIAVYNGFKAALKELNKQ